MARDRRRYWRSARELALWVGVALTFRCFVAEAYIIPSGSMEPTLLVGDRIAVNKASFGARLPFSEIWLAGWRGPERGEVVVFSDPRSPGENLVKRVIAVGGDLVEVRDGVVSVNGRALPREELPGPCTVVVDGVPGVPCRRFRERHGSYRYEVRQLVEASPSRFGPLRVPAEHFFALGDNRDQSNDSRFIGSVPLRLLRGRAMFVHFSSGPEGVRWERLLRRVH